MTVLARPRAVIFDWDGTLVDSWKAIHVAINTTFEAYGLESWTLDETRLRVRHSMRNSFPGFFGAEWEKAAKLFYDAYARVHIEHTEPLPGADALLRRLRKEGVFLGVLSNKNGDYMRREAEHLGWKSCFDRLTGATDAPEDKPSPVAFRHVLEGSAIEPDATVWMVGDAAIDMECAANAGCCGVLLGAGADVAQSGFVPTLTAADCGALDRYFATL